MPSVSGVTHTRRARTAFFRRRCTAAGVDRGDPAGQPGPQLGAGVAFGVADRELGQPHPHPRVQFAGAISDLLGLRQIDPAFPQPGQHAGQLPRTIAGPGPPGRRRHRWTSAGWWRSRPGPGRPAGRSGPATPAARRRPDPWPPAGGHAPRRSPSPTRQPPPPGRHRQQHHLNRRHHQLLHTPHARRGVRHFRVALCTSVTIEVVDLHPCSNPGRRTRDSPSPEV